MENSRLDALKAKLPGFDAKTALTYCADSEEIFWEIIGEYVSDNKTEAIKKEFEAENVENYRIYVHAVKSTSLTVGLLDLHEEAKALEMAAKEGNLEYIKANNEALLTHYNMAIEAINEILSGKE